VKRVLITGGSGFIGRRLATELLARGDLVTVLSRDVNSARKVLPQAVRVASWTPEREGSWFEELGVVDAVVHLAGERVARRWTEGAKRAIEDSRVGAAKLITEAIAQAKHKPSVLVSASAIGYYGAHAPEEQLSEDSPPGKGFLADISRRWEEAARGAEQYGVRVVSLRIGLVFGRGGPLDQIVMPYKFFLGGPIGSGKHVISWVHRDDVVGMMLFALDHAEAKGPINAVSPNPATSNELAKAIGSVMNRPSWFRAPAAIFNAAFGEAAEILTTGQNVVPARAIELGYEFRYARLVPALESILHHG
jgi:uncharacterized protein (TIGR01777 family)